MPADPLSHWRLAGLLMIAVVLAGPPARPAAANEPAPSIGLALGSGGAGGLAHIAMLEVFDELGLRPQSIAGTSIGAVMGALYAGGLDAEEIRTVFEEFGGSRLDLLSGLLQADGTTGLTGLLETDFIDGGLVELDGFLEFLGSKMEARTFDELEIELSVVATDYWTGETYVISEGELLPALAASMAVPALFAPVARDDRLLVDGGTSNPLPFHLLQDRHDVVVAIDVSGSRRPSGGEPAPGMLEMLFKTFELMQQSLITLQLRDNPPDVYIKVDTSGIRLLDFNRIEEVLAQAEPSAAKLRDELGARTRRAARP